MTLNYKNTLALTLFLVVIGIFSIIWQKPWQTFGSVAVGDYYQATTTPQVATGVNLCPARSGNIQSTTGVLGSVNVLKSGAGILTILDATTTDVTKRLGNIATSSLILAEFPASPTAGSYHFDIEFKRGFLVDYTTTGTGVSSTTISYRCEG